MLRVYYISNRLSVHRNHGNKLEILRMLLRTMKEKFLTMHLGSGKETQWHYAWQVDESLH